MRNKGKYFWKNGLKHCYWDGELMTQFPAIPAKDIYGNFVFDCHGVPILIEVIGGKASNYGWAWGHSTVIRIDALNFASEPPVMPKQKGTLSPIRKAITSSLFTISTSLYTLLTLFKLSKNSKNGVSERS